MPKSQLAEYKRKRNFGKTPEPEGREHASGGQRFVIQKHDASRLHYDFRLEIDGVLKSWAVPKGPALDPTERRLAVHVEDHPLEYGSFEGTIPKGQYGGGTVMLWDEGEFEMVGDDDPSRAYKKGKLKFLLHGKKLKGGWNLVRMGGKSREDDGDNWLLIKERDKTARPLSEYDITEKKNKSAVSNRSMEAIAKAQDAVWESNRDESKKSDTKKKAARKKSTVKLAKKPKKKPPTKAAAKKAPAKTKSARKSPAAKRSALAIDPAAASRARKASMPQEFAPELATLVKAAPDGPDWIHETKFDGYRILAMIRDGKVRLISRNANDWTGKFRPIANALAELPIDSAIIDGELTAMGKGGREDFQTLQNAFKGEGSATFLYYAFDLPYLNGYDLTKTPLIERKALLEELLSTLDNDRIRYSDHIEGHGLTVYEHACKLGLEGIISKKANSVYEQRRTKSWVKTKCSKRQEFVIGGYTNPSGARSYFGALHVGYYEDGKLVYAGKVGTGFNEKSLKAIYAALKKREREKPPFANPPRGAEARRSHWVEPELVGEVEFTEWTSEGILRHPAFQGLREDKKAREVRRERPADTPNHESPSSKPASAKSPAKDSPVPPPKLKSGDIEVAGVRISNPDRVLYPKQGLTKRALAEFYVDIADWVLPHVVKRPLSVVRCPAGSGGECFYQKHVTDAMPPAIRGIPITEKTKKEDYIIIDDLGGLVSLVQIGVLEVHPWGSREDNIERPDVLTFDLDPDVGLGWNDVIRATHELGQFVADLGLKSFLKTSGGKGVHIVIPIARRTEWDDAKAFTKAIADHFARQDPKRYIATMSKAKRKGKIFIDYLRNGRGATSVAAYSTRSKPNAPVSTPIAWDELTPSLRPDAYRVDNLRDRLDALKENPWHDYFTTKQSITAAMKKTLGLR